MKKNFVFCYALIIACNVKGVECAKTDHPCVKTDVNADVVDSVVNNVNNITNNNNVHENGLGGSSGLGGSTHNLDYPDAGNVNVDSGSVDSGISASNDAAVHSSRCSTPSPVPSDGQNWYTTNGGSDWFQLVTLDGFSEDHCTYTGKIKWFYEGIDGYWESDRTYDQPLTTFVFQFELDGSMKLNVHAPTVGYPEGYTTTSNVSYVGGCYVGLSEGSSTGFDATYRFYNCILQGGGNHPLFLNVFTGRWDNDLGRPMNVQVTYPPARG